MDDLISRQAAIDAINHICPVDTEYDCTLLDRVDVRCVLSDLPSAQPELKEINVKHQLTKDKIERLCKEMANSPVVLFPERKPGRWEEGNVAFHFTCSECGKAVTWNKYNVFCDGNGEMNFCPNCGAKMEEKHETDH